MMNTRDCYIEGHEINFVAGKCSFQDCGQYNRLVCADCLSEELRLHSQTIQASRSKQEKLAEIELENFNQQIGNQQDNDVIAYKQFIIKEEQEDKKDKQYKQDKYIKFTNYIKQYSPEVIQTAQISEDEVLLGFGGWNQKIDIYKLKNKKLFISIKLDSRIQTIKFTNDSRYLLSGDYNGYLYCFDIKQHFNLIYKHQIHKECINDLKALNNDQILTCSRDKSLIITNIKQNCQLFYIKNAHDDCVWGGIEYDRLNDFVISCSNDGFIKFFRRKNCQLSISHKTDGLGYFSIQFISSCNNLISSSYAKLVFWLIDYKRYQLIKLNKFIHIYHYNFTSVLNNRKVIVIDQEYVQIIDNYLVLSQSINHDIKDFQEYFQTRQLNSLNYIIVPGKNSLQVLKRG